MENDAAQTERRFAQCSICDVEKLRLSFFYSKGSKARTQSDDVHLTGIFFILRRFNVNFKSKNRLYKRSIVMHFSLSSLHREKLHQKVSRLHYNINIMTRPQTRILKERKFEVVCLNSQFSDTCSRCDRDRHSRPAHAQIRGTFRDSYASSCGNFEVRGCCSLMEDTETCRGFTCKVALHGDTFFHQVQNFRGVHFNFEFGWNCNVVRS